MSHATATLMAGQYTKEWLKHANNSGTWEDRITAMQRDAANGLIQVYYLCFKEDPDTPIYFGYTVSNLAEKLACLMKPCNTSTASYYLRALVEVGAAIDIQQYKTIDTACDANKVIDDCIARAKRAGIVLLNELL